MIIRISPLSAVTVSLQFFKSKDFQFSSKRSKKKTTRLCAISSKLVTVTSRDVPEQIENLTTGEVSAPETSLTNNNNQDTGQRSTNYINSIFDPTLLQTFTNRLMKIHLNLLKGNLPSSALFVEHPVLWTSR